jgi:hypothetical protein
MPQPLFAAAATTFVRSEAEPVHAAVVRYFAFRLFQTDALFTERGVCRDTHSHHLR